MKTISLDVHAEVSQAAVITEDGEVVLETRVATKAEALQRLVGSVSGSKRVVFEEGPMSGMIKDALEGLADEIISADPTRNALIGRSEDSTDEKDARRLALLARAGALHEVYVPSEPYRSLRSLVGYDYSLSQATVAIKNRIKGLCRRQGVVARGQRGLWQGKAKGPLQWPRRRGRALGGGEPLPSFGWSDLRTPFGPACVEASVEKDRGDKAS